MKKLLLILTMLTISTSIFSMKKDTEPKIIQKILKVLSKNPKITVKVKGKKNKITKEFLIKDIDIEFNDPNNSNKSFNILIDNNDEKNKDNFNFIVYITKKDLETTTTDEMAEKELKESKKFPLLMKMLLKNTNYEFDKQKFIIKKKLLFKDPLLKKQTENKFIDATIITEN